MGWYDNQNFTAPIWTEYNVQSHRTFYAKYTKDVYDVTYNLDGGTNNVGNPATFDVDDEGFILLAPTKANKAFMGWFTDAELTIPLTSLGVPGDVTVYAKFVDAFTVTFDLNGGNIGGSEADVVELLVPTGTLVGSAYNGGTPVFTDKVWTTPYWVTTDIGSTDAASLPVTANVTVFAYWVNE